MFEGVTPYPAEFQERYRARGYWREKPLRAEFADALAAHGDKIAIIDGEHELTYRQLDRLSDNLALNLLDWGLEPGERVIPQLPNCKEFPILYLALQKIGCIPICSLINHRYAEISQFAKLSGAAACIAPARHGDFDFLQMIQRIRGENPGIKFGLILGGEDLPDGFHSLDRLIENAPTRPAKDLEGIRIDPTDPAIFQLSGGTTGIPKLIPRTHNDYAYVSRMAIGATGLHDKSRMLMCLPMAHNLPLASPGLQGYLFHGRPIVLSASTRTKDIFSLVEKHGITHIPVVPALLIDWLNEVGKGEYDLSSMELIQTGGQRLHPEAHIKAKALMPSIFVQENFGMGEGMLMYVRRDDPEDVRLETVGRPVCPDDEVRLVDEDDNEVTPGEVGEFCARGPYTIRGYYQAPEHNARAFTTDGFYRSGDLMRQHPTGNYIIEGRKKDLINRGGEKISAEEIESLILAHPVVQNVACVPMPDPRLGERTCAFVTLGPGQTLTLEELVEFLTTKEIAKFKLPERLEILDEFPVSSFGKISKKSLTEMIGATLAREQGGDG
ncbi:MAG: AMP-binding protein [Rhodospirillales bacterium]|jgi:2,3-dihydroxybenzoate-AMP ligase|nr:AMP-binding protein [Rhodospirillales bacterium]